MLKLKEGSLYDSATWVDLRVVARRVKDRCSSTGYARVQRTGGWTNAGRSGCIEVGLMRISPTGITIPLGNDTSGAGTGTANEIAKV